MISATTKFKNAMTSGQLYEVVEITYADGSTQTLDHEIMRGDNSITDGASAGAFPVGVAIEKYMSLTLDNRNEQFSNKTFMNAKLEVYVKTQDSSIGRVKKGTFYVTSPESYGEVIKLTAVDLMYKADKPFSTDLVFPQTAQALLTNVCGKCGIPLGTISMTNGNLRIDKKPENMTCREVIGSLAMIEGANARIDRNGYLQFVKWNFGTSTDLKDFLSSPTVSAEDIVVTGVKVTNSLYNYTAFYNNKVDDGYVITYENELIGNKVATVAQTIGKAILGKHFRSMSGDIASNPLIEFGDMVKTYKYIPSLGEERSYLTPITDVKFSLQGRTTVSTTAEDPVRTGQSYTSQSVKTAVAQAAALVNAEKTAREEAVSNLAQQIEQNNGTYLTKEEQETGGSVYYLHDAPTIAESEIIWKLTADALAVSTDGGQSYPYGITVNGDIIANLLYTHGIDATYIKSGILTIRDPETNEVTFQADAGTGQVDIVANSFTLKGKTVENVVQETLKPVSEKVNKSVTKTDIEYYLSTSSTSLSGGTWSTNAPKWQQGKYMWSRTVTTYNNGTTSETSPVCIAGAKGDTGEKGETGAVGKSIGSITNYYLATASSSGVTISTNGWTTSVQNVTATNKYLWNYEVIKYTDGTTANTSTPCIIGAYGDTGAKGDKGDQGSTGATGAKGDTGATGKGIKSITEKYQVSTSNTTAPTSWETTVPTLTATNKYLWNYETITYTDNSTVDTA
ncbi:MAG: collagen-like protein, partial [Eubacteriales bacterium]|nr:collagen-like protein [Eubacteriales bacterium]